MNEKDTTYEVVIVDRNTREVVRRMSSLSLSKAVRGQSGANINLNHETHCVELNAMGRANHGQN